jgi:protein-S-isoprenylcysteine O-methyltransferase Ste14
LQGGFPVRPTAAYACRWAARKVRQTMSEDFSSWFPSQFAALLFVIIFFLWAACELFNRLGFHYSPRISGARRSDQGSYWVILTVVWGSMIISLLFRSLSLGVFRNIFQYVGLGMEMIGIALREWAVLSLGSLFTVVVSVAPGQKLVQHGPYRWLRHPAYTGSILTFVGFALALGTWTGALLVLFISLAGFLYRIKVEEKLLLEVFGNEYHEYMRHTWRIFPGQ